MTLNKEEAKMKCVLFCEVEGDEPECLFKSMKHAKSHTYHKHGLGYAIWKKRRMGDIITISSSVQQPKLH